MQARKIAGEAETSFASAVAIDGDTAAIGELYALHPIGDNTGVVHIHQRNKGGAGQWGQTVRLLPPTASGFDFFGDEVAAADGLLVASAPSQDYPLPNSGVAVIYELGVCAACAADLDGSGAVDFADIVRILVAWGQMDVPEDLDRDGTVDFGDILVILGAWGPCV